MYSKEVKKQYDQKRYANIKADKIAHRQPDQIDNLSEVDVAYIAGLLDGEGCLQIAYNTTLDKYQPVILVQMSDKPVLDWLAPALGTKVNHHRPNKFKAHWKTQWSVRITGKRAIKLSKRCIVYLKVKHRQAQILIQFESTFMQQGGPGHTVPAEIVQARALLKEQIHQLNGGKNRTWTMPDHF